MKKRTAVTVLLNIFFILLVLVIILPAAWLIMNSLKTNVELFTDSLALPAKVQFANYISAWNKGLYKYFGNSVIVSSISPYIHSVSKLPAGLWHNQIQQQIRKSDIPDYIRGHGPLGAGGTGSSV